MLRNSFSPSLPGPVTLMLALTNKRLSARVFLSTINICMLDR